MTELTKELMNPQDIGQPIILEDETLETNSLRVHVIWERWAEWSGELRSRIVLESYERAFPGDARPQITLVLGLTVSEAIGIGLLPFKIMAARERAGMPLTPEYRQALLDAGATMPLRGNDPQLRCATFDAAEATIKHLEEKLTHSRWTIVEEVSVYDD
ncbi:MAG: hypothetical protein HQ567_08125 [Candidatus Nealsonbacteria bacterium]|nr:hypothetical protein [Candidatus Nealsonbacteria bacterium]